MNVLAHLSIGFVAAMMCAAGQESTGSAAIEGVVRDAQGRALAGITVSLSGHAGTKTDAAGIFHFSKLAAGSYTVGAEKTTLGPFRLEEKETKRVGLTIMPTPAAEFYDEPKFVVAGVTDGASHGGHGSDTVMRSSEALTKATAALGNSGAADSGNRNEAERRHAGALEDERLGRSLEAAREYQEAAELDSSERNLFDWGTDLLTHRAPQPAIEVFGKGRRLFPRSTRMLLALAAACYANGDYEKAAQHFFAAADLNPSDPGPYLFLGKVQSVTITQQDGFLERMRRFASLHPDDAWANYYYSLTLWRRHNEDSKLTHELLETALRLDPKFAVAYLQLGIVLAEQHDFPAAIAAYKKAIELNPQMEEAHFRLADAYRLTGDKAQSQRELAEYSVLAKESAEQLERERREIQQFVIGLKN